MKKKNIIFKLLFSIIIFSFLFLNVGLADWVIYKSKDITSTITTKETPVCYNKDTNVYYTSVEKALDKASSGQTVNVIPGSNPTITKDCEVKSGVTLNLAPAVSNCYKASLTLDSSGSVATLLMKRSTDGGTNYSDYLKWVGTYGFKTSTFKLKCSRTAHSATHEVTISYVYFTFKSQIYYGDNSSGTTESISRTINFSVDTSNIEGQCSQWRASKCSESSFSVTKYVYNFNVTINGFASSGVNHFIPGTYVFTHSKSGEVNSSNLGTFNSTTVIETDYSDVSNYSSTAVYQTNSLTEDKSLVVSIDKNITLTNNGTIYVGGSLAGGTNSIGGYSGQTYGQYSTLSLGTNAKLISNGSIYCYGYIKESSENNGSSLITNSGSKTYVPFVIRDFRNGGVTVSCVQKDKDKKCFPFNEYEIRNITCIANVKYGSSLNGWGNLYAGNQQNATTMEMIGTSSSSFIQLNDSSSYVYAKFDETSDICDLKIYNGCSFNSMSLSLSMGISFTVSSNSFNFAVSYRYQVSLLKTSNQSSASFSIPEQSFLFLPGSSLKVGEGCTLTATSSALIFYESWPTSSDNNADTVVKKNYSGYSKYGTTRAYLVNNGTVNVATITGLIKSEVSGATLQFTTNSSTSYQISKTHNVSGWDQLGVLGGASTSIDTWATITTKTTFYDYSNSAFNTSSFNTSVSSGTYSSVQDSNGLYGFHV